MNGKPGRLPVLGAVVGSWRFVAANPGAALRVGWLPVALMTALAVRAADAPKPLETAALWAQLYGGLAMLFVMIVVLVAWQRMVLFGAEGRPGLLPLRLGRAELRAVLHFPLVLILFVPLQLWPLAAWLWNAPFPPPGSLAGWMPWIALAVVVFPLGPLLARTTLMLAAIAAAGGRRISLPQTANAAWAVGRDNTARLFLAIMLAGLPIALAAKALDTVQRSGAELPLVVALGAAGGALAVLYMLVVGGTLARAWATLGGMPEAKKARR